MIFLQNAKKNKSRDDTDAMVHIAIVEWGWSWEQFLKTPIPIFMAVAKQHEKKIKKQNKKK